MMINEILSVKDKLIQLQTEAMYNRINDSGK